jgi:hypothetical protein
MADGHPGALALGIVGLLTVIVLVGGAFGLVGLVLGVVGLRRVHTGRATNLRASAAGTVFSAIALLATVGLMLSVGSR